MEGQLVRSGSTIGLRATTGGGVVRQFVGIGCGSMPSGSESEAIPRGLDLSVFLLKIRFHDGFKHAPGQVSRRDYSDRGT